MQKLFYLLILYPLINFAGVNGVTHHSRANCINNESISWKLRGYHWFYVTSYHYNLRTGALIHSISNGHWAFTWRYAAVDWYEGGKQMEPLWLGWKVVGTHWMRERTGQPERVAVEESISCSGYDGWWEY